MRLPNRCKYRARDGAHTLQPSRPVRGATDRRLTILWRCSSNGIIRLLPRRFEYTGARSLSPSPPSPHPLCKLQSHSSNHDRVGCQMYLSEARSPPSSFYKWVARSINNKTADCANARARAYQSGGYFFDDASVTFLPLAAVPSKKGRSNERTISVRARAIRI